MLTPEEARARSTDRLVIVFVAAIAGGLVFTLMSFMVGWPILLLDLAWIAALWWWQMSGDRADRARTDWRGR